MPKPAIATAVATEIQRQLNHENTAAYAYEAMAYWFDDRNLKGFARFFHKQAVEEREHARKFVGHLLDRGVLPELSLIAAPKGRFESVMQAAQQALAMEQENTKGIHTAYEVALREKDYAAQMLLHWFIKEQVEEEAWANELIDRVARAECPGSLAELDRHIERHLGDKVDD
jgi:ferritin